MKSRYLWNRAIENVSLDYSLCYDFFFFSILDGVAAQDEVNREDGHWQGQKRMYYYSRLESDAPLSRTPGEAYVGSGIYLLDATRLGDDYIGIVVMVVIPGTPAAEAGLVRGDFITAVNGEEVTESNYQSLGRAVYDGAVDVTVNSVTWTDNGTTPVLTPKGNVQLGSATFTSPAIYMDKVVEIEESDKKAGYLLYMGFDVDYDEELIAAFTPALSMTTGSCAPIFFLQFTALSAPELQPVFDRLRHIRRPAHSPRPAVCHCYLISLNSNLSQLQS